MHDAKTDRDKGELFAACRAGTVAVLLGSTEKMGVGTNVQFRAIALHHLDCPWRPADVAQREGRGREAEKIVDLTQRLIRIPSVNPPGEFYRDCVELIGARLERRGFAIEYVRAEGAPGDTDRYPRWNVIARREGEGRVPVSISTATSTLSPRRRLDPAAVRGAHRGWPHLRSRSCDMKGGLAAASSRSRR